MRKMMLFVFGMIIFVINNPFVFADTIILKSGQSVEGKIIEKTDEYIKIDLQGSISTYNMAEVAKVEEEKSSSSSDIIAEPSVGLSDLEKSVEQAFLDGKYEDAELAMKKIVQLDPKNPELYIGLAMVCYYAGHPEESVSAFQEAINLNPSDFDVHLYLSIVYDSMGDYEKAREELTTAIELSREKMDFTTTLVAETLLKKLGNK